MIKQRDLAFRRQLRLILTRFAIATLFFAASPIQPMQGSGATIVPILPLLLDEDPIDPTLPIAEAGPDDEALVGEVVQLDGSASTDPSNLPLNFLWAFISKPANSVTSFDDETSATPQFLLDVPGTYEIQLIVDNGDKVSLPDTVTIINTNRAPVADAGENVLAELLANVQLNGGNSSDIDGDPLTYFWSFVEKPAASTAEFDDATLPNPQFTPDVSGNYVLDLIVNDGVENSASDQVEVLAGAALSLEVDDVFFGVGRTSNATISLNFPAPPQGIDVTLDVDDTIIDLSMEQISFADGETQKNFILTGLSPGTTLLSASADNVETAEQSIEVSGALISIDAIQPLSPSASRSVAISLSDAAPMGGVTVDLESLDTAIATVSPSSLFIAEGQSTPAGNAQVTGVGLGITALRATGPGFAPDEREIEVALAAEFNTLSLSVPETLTREIVLTLDAPAPQSGVTFDLSIVGDANFDVQNTVTIEDGQTQSQPIVLTGLTEGVSTLRASADGFLDADATITVVDAPNVYLSANGSNAHLVEVVVGVQLQTSYRLRLEVAPNPAVDVHVSIPPESGVLLSTSPTIVGTNTLILEDQLSTSTPPIYFQGLELGDDVPLTIEVFEANTLSLAGYEALTTTIDVDPSGVYVSTADLTIDTFTTTRSVAVQTALLYDDEAGVLSGQFRAAQRVRAGETLTIPMQSANAGVLVLPNGANDNLTINSNDLSGTLAITPVANGSTEITIVNQPAGGFSLPTDLSDDMQVTIIAPEAYLRSTGSNSPLSEAIVGLDLQQLFYVGLDTAPPAPVDIHLSVTPASGVLLSGADTLVGSDTLVLEDVTSTRSPAIYIQGTALGDNVPLAIEVFEANTTTPIGYDELASTVDIDPSGLSIITGDYTTTTFSSDGLVTVRSSVLFDAETPTMEGQARQTQRTRAGLNLSIPIEVDEPTIVGLPNGLSTDNLLIADGDSTGTLSLEPISAGTAFISMTTPLPLNFSVPTDNDNLLEVTVNAPNAFFRSLGSASYQAEAIVGIDLQTTQRIRLETSPPGAVDIQVSVPDSSGVLLSTDSTVAGGTQLLMEDVVSLDSPNFYVQGTALGDDVPITINVYEADTTTPAGYNILSSTVDVDPSGVYISSGDITTTTFSANSTIQLRSALLYDDEGAQDGQYRTNQAVRGGLSLSVPMEIDDTTVAVLPSGSTGTATIAAGATFGTIELDPLTAGIATIAISAQPNANFTLPTDRNGQITGTVTAPDARFNLNTVNVGDELQQLVSVTLEVAPPNPVDVTIEVIAPSVALVSKDGSQAGSGSVTFSGVTGTSVGSIYIQGLTLDAATQIRVTAAGYNDGTSDVEVKDSGFRILGSFGTIADGTTRDFTVRSVRLEENGTFSTNQAVRGGASFDVTVSSSMPAVGTVTSPVTLGNGSASGTTTFTAVDPGTTTISVAQPAGFTPPVGLIDGDITVE